MTSAPPSDRSAGRQRKRVLQVVRRADGPVDAQQIADALQIHVTTARFHLGRWRSRV